MKCEGTPTNFQPDEDEWRCPRCGVSNSGFQIESQGDDCSCENLHVDDEVGCSCGFFADGQHTVDAILAAQSKRFVECPTCQGAGRLEQDDWKPKVGTRCFLLWIGKAMSGIHECIVKDTDTGNAIVVCDDGSTACVSKKSLYQHREDAEKRFITPTPECHHACHPDARMFNTEIDTWRCTAPNCTFEMVVKTS